MSHSISSFQAYEGFRAQRAKVDLAFQLFISGESIRRTARQVQVSPSTIQRWNERFYSSAVVGEVERQGEVLFSAEHGHDRLQVVA